MKIDAEKLLDWIVLTDISSYKITKEGDYKPDGDSHFYLKGSLDRFVSNEIIKIFANDMSDDLNERWQYAVADHNNYLKRHK